MMKTDIYIVWGHQTKKATIVEDKNTCQAGIDRLLNKYEFYHYGFDHNDQ